MITDIEISSTMDVSKENETYNIGKKNLPKNMKVAAVSWLSTLDSRYDARLLVLKLIFSLIMIKKPGFTFWYFLGDSAWQYDTRIIRHKKLWKRLKSRGIEVTHFSNSYEEMLERDNKLKYFGAILLSELSIESVVKALSEENCSYLVALPESVDIKEALCLGWDSHGGFDKELLQYVINNKGIIFKTVGEFDDPENGFVGLGVPEHVTNLVKSRP